MFAICSKATLAFQLHKSKVINNFSFPNGFANQPENDYLHSQCYDYRDLSKDSMFRCHDEIDEPSSIHPLEFSQSFSTLCSLNLPVSKLQKEISHPSSSFSCSNHDRPETKTHGRKILANKLKVAYSPRRLPNSRVSLVSVALCMSANESNNDSGESNNNSKGSEKKKKASEGKGDKENSKNGGNENKGSNKKSSSLGKSTNNSVAKGAVSSVDGGNNGTSNTKSMRSQRRSTKMNNRNRQRRQRQPRDNSNITPSDQAESVGSAVGTRSPKSSSNKSKKHSTSNTTKAKKGSSRSSVKTNDNNNSLKDFKSEVVEAGTSNKDATSKKENGTNDDKDNKSSNTNDKLTKRVVQLESLVSTQVREMQKLRREIDELTKTVGMFSNVVGLLREAGLRIDEDDDVAVIDNEMDDDDDEEQGRGGKDTLRKRSSLPKEGGKPEQQQIINDDAEIFGNAPSTVIDAADAAGSSILAAILAGKHRMLVDVRDAELTRDPALFVEFIELAILPVAAGLEGLDGDEYTRNRVKIVFPTVKELMSYRRSMALAAPDVVALSTLGFDPVEEKDNLIVVVAPSPDDVAGVAAMKKLIARTDRKYVVPEQRITQPVVVLNHHMLPMDLVGLGSFTVVYHLRLLTVQYMTGDTMPDYVAKEQIESDQSLGGRTTTTDESEHKDEVSSELNESDVTSFTDEDDLDEEDDESLAIVSGKGDEEDFALEAAMIHAREIGVQQGVTRAMVIRAYPK